MSILSSLTKGIASYGDDLMRGAANSTDDVARNSAKTGQKLLMASNDKFSDYNLKNLLDSDTPSLLNLYKTANYDDGARVADFLGRQANSNAPINVAYYDTLDELSDDARSGLRNLFDSKNIDVDDFLDDDALVRLDDDYLNSLLENQGFDYTHYNGEDYLFRKTDNPYVGIEGANRLFDDAAGAFSPNYDVSRSWGAGDVPSTYVPFFDGKIRIANHDNSYDHPYGVIYDTLDLIRGNKTLGDVEQDVLEQMQDAIGDGAISNYLDDFAGYEGQTTFADIDDALSRAVGKMNPNFMKYSDGKLSVLGGAPMQISQATPYFDIEDFVYQQLKDRGQQFIKGAGQQG